MDYLDFFKLREDPFGLTPDSTYFYPSKMHNEALSSLDYAVEQKEGFSLIAGEPGTGKTTILKIFIERWKEKAEIALIMTPRLSPEELLQAVIEDFNIQLQTSNKNEMLKAFRDFLLDRSMAGKRVIIIVDEAQNLSDDSLEELRLLSNLETEKEKLLQIILVGQPELRERLHSANLKQLDQRLTIRSFLRPLVASETSDYVNFRLIKAGKGTASFSDAAMRLMYQFSGGIPRLINLVASRAMMVAYIASSHQVDQQHVQNAVSHLSDVSQARPSSRRWLAYTIAAVVFLALIGASLMLYQTRTTDGISPGKVPASQASPMAPVPAPIGTSLPREGPPPSPVGTSPPAPRAVPDAKDTHHAAIATTTLSKEHMQKPKDLVTVTVTKARIRKAPRLGAPVGPLLIRGTALEVIGQQQNADEGNLWYRVVLQDGTEGWIVAYQVNISSGR